MKTLLFILLMCALLLGGCASSTPEPAPDVPRYTADQVIAVAEAYSPSILIRYETLSWKVLYVGQGTWLVAKSCVDRLGRNSGTVASWYFYEDTGKLVPLQSQSPTPDNPIAFLEADKTNEIPYTEDFKCHDFAATLFENAEAEGLEVGYVSVHLGDYDFHALNVFNTDEGLIFIDNSGGHDAFVMLEVGKPYMMQYSVNGGAYASTILDGELIVGYRIIWDMEDWGTMWKSPTTLPPMPSNQR